MKAPGSVSLLLFARFPDGDLVPVGQLTVPIAVETARDGEDGAASAVVAVGTGG